MGMSIKTAILWLSNIAEHKGEYIIIYNEDAEAVKIGVETMRKYQKIEEIVGNYGFDTSWLCLKKIREVMEDGTENNHHASNT